MSADATLKGIAISQQEGSLIGEALTDETLLPERKDSSGKIIPLQHTLPAHQAPAKNCIQ